jgi:hypothetical protein
MDTCQLCLEILSSDVDLVSEDPTGQVRGGSLQVYGLMKRATWCTLSQSLILVEGLLEMDDAIQKHSLGTSDFSFFPDTRENMSNLGLRDMYCLLVQSQCSTMDGLVLCSTNVADRFQRLGVFHAAGVRACTALKYNLRSSYGESRAKAVNITIRPDRHAQRNIRDLKSQRAGPELFTLDKYTPYRHSRPDTGPWKSTNTSLQGSWDPAGRSWTKDVGSTIQGNSSADIPWTPVSNLPSTQSVSSRRSKTKAVHAMHQAKMADPLSVYLLDPAHMQEQYQRLKPRMIALV